MQNDPLDCVLRAPSGAFEGQELGCEHFGTGQMHARQLVCQGNIPDFAPWPFVGAPAKVAQVWD